VSAPACWPSAWPRSTSRRGSRSRTGCPSATTEAYKASLRHITDVGQRRLSIAGLKAGEVQEHDLSDRMREFLTRWNEPAEPGPALPPADTIEARATRLPETEPDRQ